MKRHQDVTKILLLSTPILGLILSLEQAWADPAVFDSCIVCTPY